MTLNGITGHIVGGAMKVHSKLGPGLVESVYERCLAYELHKVGLSVIRQHRLPIIYDGIKIGRAFRIDLLVENAVVVEVKAVARVMPIHHATLLSYLRLSGYRLGLLINFNEVHLRDGLKRLINGY